MTTCSFPLKRFPAKDLYWASRFGELSKVQELLRLHVDPNGYETDKFRWTPLWTASFDGHTQIVRELLAAGAHVHATDSRGWSPLIAAVVGGHLDIVKVLKDAGANLQHKHNSGSTVLDFAKLSGHQKVIFYLCQALQVPLPTSQTPLSHGTLRKATSSPVPYVANPTTSTSTVPGSALSKLWSSAINGSLTEQSVVDFLISPNVKSIQTFIIAHNILLLAIRQKVITLGKLKSFHDDPDYVATNIYLPLRGFMNMLDDYEKVTCNYVLRHAQNISLIENRHVFAIKLNTDEYGQIDRTRQQVSKVIEKIARQLQHLDNRVNVLAKWSSRATEKFRRVCKNNQRMVGDIFKLGDSLNNLHDVLKKNEHRKMYACTARLLLSFLPAVGGALGAGSSACAKILLRMNLEDLLEVEANAAKGAINHFLSVDLSSFRNVGILTSAHFMSSLDEPTKNRMVAAIECSEFRSVARFRKEFAEAQKIMMEMEETSEIDEGVGSELESRFSLITVESTDGTAAIQDATPELHAFCRRRLPEFDASERDVKRELFKHCNEVARLDCEGFQAVFTLFQEKYGVEGMEWELADKFGCDSKELAKVLLDVSRIIKEKLEKQYTGREIENFQDIPLSQYLALQREDHQPFLGEFAFDDSSDLQKALNLMDPKYWIIHLPSDSLQCLAVKARNAQRHFLLLINDFFLAFDDSSHEVNILVPGSKVLQFQYAAFRESPNFFDNLIGTSLSVQQVYFLARRLVQLTGAQWKYSCFAEIESALIPNASMLRSVTSSVFSDVYIDLFPMSFDCLACVEEVGLLDIDEERDDLHRAGVKLFGTVIGFERREDEISQPCLLHGVELRPNDDFLDCYDLFIGGDHFDICPERESPLTTVNQLRSNIRRKVGQHNAANSFLSTSGPSPAPERSTDFRTTLRTLSTFSTGNDNRLSFESVCRSKLQFESARSPAVFNLAFCPQNMTFGELANKKYNEENIKELETDFLEIGYGMQLSKALRRHAASSIFRKHRGSSTSVAEVQHSLLEKWRLWCITDMKPLTLVTATRRTIGRGHHVLVLNGGILYIAKSERNLTRSATVGPSWFKANFAISEIDLTTRAKVWNVYDAAVKVTGLPFKPSVFPGGGIKLTKSQMSEMLGALVLVCTLLKNRVNPSGRFRHNLWVQREDEHAIRQAVEFNIPLPTGIACSALCHRKTPLLILSVGPWDKNRNFDTPVFTGVSRNDSDLEEIVTCTFENA